MCYKCYVCYERPYRLAARTWPSQGRNQSSILCRVTIDSFLELSKKPSICLVFCLLKITFSAKTGWPLRGLELFRARIYLIVWEPAFKDTKNNLKIPINCFLGLCKLFLGKVGIQIADGWWFFHEFCFYSINAYNKRMDNPFPEWYFIGVTVCLSCLCGMKVFLFLKNLSSRFLNVFTQRGKKTVLIKIK